MIVYFINVVLLFAAAWLIRKIPCCQNIRGALRLGKLTETEYVTITIGNTTYITRGFFKPTGKTLSEKLLRNMEKELDSADAACYNIDKSQKGLDCKQERSIV